MSIQVLFMVAALFVVAVAIVLVVKKSVGPAKWATFERWWMTARRPVAAIILVVAGAIVLLR